MMTDKLWSAEQKIETKVLGPVTNGEQHEERHDNECVHTAIKLKLRSMNTCEEETPTDSQNEYSATSREWKLLIHWLKKTEKV